jgi:hypothetical protein
MYIHGCWGRWYIAVLVMPHGTVSFFLSGFKACFALISGTDERRCCTAYAILVFPFTFSSQSMLYLQELCALFLIKLMKGGDVRAC